MLDGLNQRRNKMQIILLSLSIAALITFGIIPIAICYLVTGKINIKYLKKTYLLLFGE